MCNKVVTDHFNVLSKHLHSGTEVNHKTSVMIAGHWGQHLNPRPPNYRVQMPRNLVQWLMTRHLLSDLWVSFSCPSAAWMRLRVTPWEESRTGRSSRGGDCSSWCKVSKAAFTTLWSLWFV